MWGRLRGSTEHTNTFLGQKVKKDITFSWKVTGTSKGAWSNQEHSDMFQCWNGWFTLQAQKHFQANITFWWWQHKSVRNTETLSSGRPFHVINDPIFFHFDWKFNSWVEKKKWGNKNRQLFFPVICCRITWGELQSELVSESVTSER